MEPESETPTRAAPSLPPAAMPTPAAFLRQRHHELKQAVDAVVKDVDAVVKDVVKDVEKWARWSYRDMTGEKWDAQPACFITDYVLAVEALWCGAHVAYATWPQDDSHHDATWYKMYFFAMAISAATGGLMHHMAFEVVRGVRQDARPLPLLDGVRVFGVPLPRKTVDTLILVLWRVVLGVSILSNFALVALAARRYIGEPWLVTVMAVATVLYLGLTVCATVVLDARFLVGGYLPAMLFGLVTSAYGFQWRWDHAASEILIYVLKFFSGLVQGLAIGPSRDVFNHNALSHVIMCAATSMMFVHFRLP